MEDQEIIRTIDSKNNAYEALRQITGQEHISVMVSNIGTHLAMWVCWMDDGGNPVSRQFSWSKEQPGHDGLRLQWVYDALWKYGRLQRMIQNTTWNDEDKDIIVHL